MDQGVAALLGAAVGFGGTAITVGVQELRARAQDRRAHADELVRIRGMTRMIGAELSSIRLKLANAQLQKPRDADFQFSTQAWDRYGPDICAELPLEVVDRVLVAYSSIDITIHGLTGKQIGLDPRVEQDFELLSESTDPVHREAAVKYMERLRDNRDLLLSVVTQAYNALYPFFGDGRSEETTRKVSPNIANRSGPRLNPP
jgi:hypothetical protein